MTDNETDPLPHPLEILAEHGRTFHFASHLLGETYRTRAARLYAFCRYVDDLADKAKDLQLAKKRLLSLKRDLTLRTSMQPQCTQMLLLIEETAMPLTPVIALIDGAMQDLDPVNVTSEAQLIQYAYQVAGTVGLMMCAVLDVKDPKALPYAIDLGMAMQLTNIARDVGEDAELGRVYLPSDWVGPLTPDQICGPTLSQAQTLRAATRRMLFLADEYYDSGLQGLYYLPRGARWGILVAAKVYREIGSLIAKANYQSWDRRAIVSKRRKIKRASTAILAHVLKDRFKQRHPLHNPALHRDLHHQYGANQSKAA